MIDISKGYYIVGDQAFLLKYDAMVYSTTTNQPIHWNFNYATFAKQAASPRLYTPVLELYKRRAQQLRDNNDYVILAYSGGADSQTILDAFLDNDIKLDEIWVDHQSEMLEKSHYVVSTDKSAINLPSEWYLVIKPKLDEIRITHPDIKIQVTDVCSSLMYDDNRTQMEDAALNLGYIHSYHGQKRWRYAANYARAMQDKYPKVCMVMGMEKCIPFIEGDQYGFVFTDASLFVKSDVIEYFYWTADMPEIVTEQAHWVWDYLKANRPYLNTVLRYKALNPKSWYLNRAYSFDGIVKSICYPKWDNSTHQVNKQTIFNGEGAGWYTEQFRTESFYDKWASIRASGLSQLNLSANFHLLETGLYEINKHLNTHILGTL